MAGRIIRTDKGYAAFGKVVKGMDVGPGHLWLRCPVIADAVKVEQIWPDDLCIVYAEDGAIGVTPHSLKSKMNAGCLRSQRGE
jgi:hypothetical protein